MRRDIVVGTDGSQIGTAAVQWAAHEAARRACPLWIVHVVERHASEPALDAGREVLEAAAAAARSAEPDIRVVPELRTGEVTGELLDEAASAGMLVLGSRGHGGLRGLVVGSVCQHVAGQTNDAVVVVRKAADTEFGEIVVGYDGSEGSRRALAYGFEEASLRGARVRVVLAWILPVTGYEVGIAGNMDAVLGDARDSLETEVASWREKHPDVEAVAELRMGHPESVLREVSQTADLVVVGSRGRGPIRSTVLGSVSHDVLLHAQCPVAVVGRT